MPQRGAAVSLLHHLRPRMPELSAENSENIGHQAVLSTTGMILAGVVRFGYSAAIGLVFGKIVLGQVNSAISLALFVSLLYPSASAYAATKFIARARGAGALDEARAVMAHLIRLTYASAVVVGVASALVAPSLLHISVSDAVLTAFLVVANSGYLLARSLLYGGGWVVRATVWDFVTSVLSVALLAVVVLAHGRAALLLPLTVGYALYSACNLPRLSRTRHRVEQPLRGEMAGFIRISLVNSLATGGLLQLSLVATQHWDPVQAGAFAAALTLATPAALVSRSLSSVLFPALSAAHGRGEHDAARSQVDLSTRALFMLSVLVFAPLMLVSPLLIRIIFPRPQFAVAALVLPILLVSVMGQNAVIGATNLLLTRSHREGRIVMLSSIAGAVVSIAGWFIWAPHGGFVTIAWWFLGGAAFASAVPVVVVWRRWSMPWRGTLIRFCLGAATAGLGSFVLQQHRAGALVQVAAAVAFVVLWLLVSWPETQLAARIFIRPLVGRFRKASPSTGGSPA